MSNSADPRSNRKNWLNSIAAGPKGHDVVRSLYMKTFGIPAGTSTCQEMPSGMPVSQMIDKILAAEFPAAD